MGKRIAGLKAVRRDGPAAGRAAGEGLRDGGAGPSAEAGVVRRRASHVRRGLAAIAVVALGLLPGLALADPTPYTLTPFTKINLKIVQFLPESGDYKSWDAIGGALTVGADGMLSIPAIGTIAANGLTADQLASEVAKRLQARLGLVDLPDAAVDIVDYPPIYLIGMVGAPGEYHFRPDMTVLQAVALAGGRYRGTDAATSSDAIKLQAGLEGSVGDILRAKATIARLEAELANADHITFPPELANGNTTLTKAIIAQENIVFGTRRDEYDRQNAGLADLIALYKAEIDVLNQKGQALDDQVAVAQKQLDGVTGLVKSGVATLSRQTDLERGIAGLRADRLDNTIASMTAQQGLSETQRNINKLQDDRRSSASQDLQTAQVALDKLMQERQTNLQLLGAASAQTAAADAKKQASNAGLLYTIMRHEGDKTVEIAATETTPLEPGDLLKVDLAQSSGDGIPTATDAALAVGDLQGK